MRSDWMRFLTLGFVAVALAFGGCGSGSDGSDGADGEDGEDGGSVIDARLVTEEFLETLTIESVVTDVMVESPPVVTFTLATDKGVPLVGIVPYYEDSSRFVRFTMCKLVPGEGTAPNEWVAYVRDGTSGAPDYDTGSSLVDNGDGSYVFTFNTDVKDVDGVPWEGWLTHRVAGQLGSSSVPVTPQNFIYDYVPEPDGGQPAPETRNIAQMASCNECHDDLVFHGRRFKVGYCIACHNPDLAEGEGGMAYMTHRIHAAGTFDVLADHGEPLGDHYTHLGYPQDLANCLKCHGKDDKDSDEYGYEPTEDRDNWKTVPGADACYACHDTPDGHDGRADSTCAGCHPATGGALAIVDAHITINSTPNNPMLLDGQANITYELIEAVGSDPVVVRFKILDGGTAIDITDLPVPDGSPNLILGPTLLLAWAEEQGNIEEPADYNNLGNSKAQPNSVSIADLVSAAKGTISYDAGSGEHTATITDEDSVFPEGASMRAVGLQGYLVWDRNGDGSYQRDGTDVPLHTPSKVIPLGPLPEPEGDDFRDASRRVVVDTMKCADCHEWFEGHGGNRVGGLSPGETSDNDSIQICTLCHVPNQSSTGREVGDLDRPEDAQNLKDMIHGIHSSAFRTRDYTHYRPGSHGGLYNWDHVTFPAESSNCSLCHKDGTWEFPLVEGLLPTTVRTTTEEYGDDAAPEAPGGAYDTVPNEEDWINTPMASSCFYCHTSNDALAHMMQNGALLSLPDPDDMFSQPRFEFWDGEFFESCTVCHGPGKSADIEAVHNK